MNRPDVRSSAQAIPLRDRVLIASCILLVSALAWAYLVSLDQRMSSAAATMAGMRMAVDAPWRASDALLTFVMWTVMMIGMMGTTAAPMLLLFAGSHRRRSNGGVPTAVLLFGLGYLTTWTGFSACATLAQWALHHAALLSPTMMIQSPRLAGVLLVMAGVYQVTPTKRACLAHCETPMGFLMNHWHEGRGGAFRMGLHHGVYCVGCCWALMAVLFVVGVMNLLWVALLTLFILAERVGRSGAIVSRVGATIMMGLGILLIAG